VGAEERGKLRDARHVACSINHNNNNHNNNNHNNNKPEMELMCQNLKFYFGEFGEFWIRSLDRNQNPDKIQSEWKPGSSLYVKSLVTRGYSGK